MRLSLLHDAVYVIYRHTNYVHHFMLIIIDIKGIGLESRPIHRYNYDLEVVTLDHDGFKHDADWSHLLTTQH